MKRVYFVVANLWLLVAFTVLLGGQVVRTQPTMCAWFGIGRWFYPGPYTFIVLCCLALSVVWLLAAWRTPSDRQ